MLQSQQHNRKKVLKQMAINNFGMNPMQLFQFVQAQKNPQQFMLNALKQGGSNNPVLANIVSLAEQGKTNEIEQVVRNVFKERGLDFDKEFTSFKQQLGIK